MTRLIATIVAISLLGLAACEQPEKKADDMPEVQPSAGGEAPEEQTPPSEQPEAADEEPETPETGDTATGAEEGPEAEDTEPSAKSDACPEARQPSGMCAQVITWAKDPDTGTCCEYPTPCHAPKNWKTFSSKDACGE